MKGYLFISNGVKPGLIIDKKTYVDIESFSYSAIDAVHRMGYKIYRGYNVSNPELLHCNQYDITYYDQHIYRNIFAFRDNYKAYKNLCGFLRKHSDIEVIHCNTPIGGILGRICGHKFHKKVIYTAHGFHFYKGASLLNWLIYYPIEKFLAKWTDVIITINKEDYLEAQQILFAKRGKAYYVPGVGVDTSKFKDIAVTSPNIREELQLDENAIVVVAVGRLDMNKNNATIIKAIAKTNCKNLHLIVCGEGNQRGNLECLIAELGVQDRIHLQGNRCDVPAIYHMSDIFVLASFREGLSRSIMEGMISGLPCVVTGIRGNRELITPDKGGILVNPQSVDEFALAFEKLAGSKVIREQYGSYNKEKVEEFSIEASKKAFYEIFQQENSMKNQYICKKVCFFDLVSYHSVSKILMACGKDMAEKYGLHHWENSSLKAFLIVCYLSLKNDIWLVKDKAGSKIATFQTKKTKKGFHFGKLATDPVFAGKGIGSFCMAKIESLAVELGCNNVYMEVYIKSEHAQDFYLHRGYTLCGETESLRYKEQIFSKQLII